MPVNGHNLVPATAMAAAVGHDPQLRLPACPRFLDGLVVVPLADGLLVEGTDERQVFRGRAATILLPRLLPLLDGTRDPEAIAAALPDVPAQAVGNALALLYTRGLLEDGAADTGPDLTGAAPELLAFLRRHVDSTRVNRSAAQAVARLLGVRLAVAGPAPAAEQLVTELGRMGVTHAVHCAGAPPAGTDLVIALAAGPEDQEAMAGLDDLCAAQGLPWLRAVCTNDQVEIGPYFYRRETTCYHCFAAGQDGALPAAPPTPTRLAAGLGLLATEIIYLVSRISPPVSLHQMVRFQFADWSQQRSHALRLPGCAVCCPLPGQSRRPAELALAYEQAVAFPVKRWIHPKDHQIHYRPANLKLQREHKHYPSSPTMALPAAAATPAPAAGYLEQMLGGTQPAPAPLDLDKLAGLLLRGGGLRRDPQETPEKPQRWAPTGGNLGSVQIYVVARHVQGLEPGCYFYEPFAHTLVALPAQRTPAELAQAVRSALPGAHDDCSALLVLSGALHRVVHKYGPFAYRITHFDAGAAVAQLRAVAGGYGLRLRVADRWDDELLLAELGLSGEAEPITAVLTVSDRPAR